jgi:hypothetical protein
MGEDTRFILQCLFGLVSATGMLLYWMLKMILREAINAAMNELREHVEATYVQQAVFEQLEKRVNWLHQERE